MTQAGILIVGLASDKVIQIAAQMGVFACLENVKTWGCLSPLLDYAGGLFPGLGEMVSGSVIG